MKTNPGLGSGEGRWVGSCLIGTFGENEKVLEMDSGDVCTTM